MNKIGFSKKVKNKRYLKTLLSFKVLFLLLITATNYGFAQAEQADATKDFPIYNSFGKGQSRFMSGVANIGKTADEEKSDSFLPATDAAENEQSADSENDANESPSNKKTANPDDKKSDRPGERFHWKPALIESGIFLGIQHGFRMTQPKTTGELGGPFFRDWSKSIKNLHGWNDGDSPFTNNFAHPLQGGVTGRIFVNNSDRSKKLEFGKSIKYWDSRWKAFVWSAAWSTQFEFSPVSEASLGNVGLREKNGHSTMAWTDLVMTPIVGTGVLVGEDAIDKYILKNWLERKSDS